MKRVDNRQKHITQIRAKQFPSERKGISIQEARKYFRKKGHNESPTAFWKQS